MSSAYPPSAFYFKVAFDVMRGVTDTSFQEVSGIDREMATVSLAEGGENRFVHQLPTEHKPGKLVLKRGIAGMESPLLQWCKSVLEGDFSAPIKPMVIHVYLMNELQVPIRGWAFTNTYPLKWTVEPFQSTKNEVAIETIELAYNMANRLI